MNEIQTIQSKIYEIRGQRVMLDFDLAAMYGVETRRLNEQVKRNIERFPEDFMFQLTKGELEILRSQIATSNTTDNQADDYWISQIATSNFAKMGLRKTPYAFTENGVAMLSSVLRSPLAIQVNIGIMRAFTEFRKIATSLSLPNTAADVAQLRKDFEDLKLDIEDILHDQNDINESTRQQLDAISMNCSQKSQDKSQGAESDLSKTIANPNRQKNRPLLFLFHYFKDRLYFFHLTSSFLHLTSIATSLFESVALQCVSFLKVDQEIAKPHSACREPSPLV